MRLSELCLAAGVTPPPMAETVEIAGICADSRRVRPGDLFVALPGHSADGAAYISQAVYAGAVAVLTAYVPPDMPRIPVIKTDFARKVSAEMLKALHGHPERDLMFLAVTGTKGKTTVAYTAFRLLCDSGIPTAFCGTLGALFDGKRWETGNTTPDLFFLIPLLAAWRQAGCRAVCLEASSQALADDRLVGLPVSTAVLTSIGRDHIGPKEHRDFAGYLSAKRKLFTDFGASLVLLPSDVPFGDLLTATDAERVVCTVLANGDERPLREPGVRLLSEDVTGANFMVDGRKYRLPVPGLFSLSNAFLAVQAVSRMASIPAEDLYPLLESIHVPGRLETCTVAGRVAVIDYAHNAMSLCGVADLYRSMTRGRLVGVFGSVGGRGWERRRELARAAEEKLDFSVITADDTDGEALTVVCADIYASFHDKTKARVVFDRAEAIRYAFRLSAPGDILLLLGKGHETALREGKGRRAFSERAVLESLDLPF